MQDVQQVNAPTQMPPSIEISAREKNDNVMATFASSPKWHAWNAVWPQGMSAMWFETQVYRSMEFSISTQYSDLADHRRFMWTTIFTASHMRGAGVGDMRRV